MLTQQASPSHSEQPGKTPYNIHDQVPPVTAPHVQGPLSDSSASDATPAPSFAPAVPAPGATPAQLQDFREQEMLKTQQWNEERIERRLRGDYERAGKALSELVRPFPALVEVSH